MEPTRLIDVGSKGIKYSWIVLSLIVTLCLCWIIHLNQDADQCLLALWGERDGGEGWYQGGRKVWRICQWSSKTQLLRLLSSLSSFLSHSLIYTSLYTMYFICICVISTSYAADHCLACADVSEWIPLGKKYIFLAKILLPKIWNTGMDTEQTSAEHTNKPIALLGKSLAGPDLSVLLMTSLALWLPLNSNKHWGHTVHNNNLYTKWESAPFV